MTTEELRELLDYNPETGVLTWKIRSRNPSGRESRLKTWNTLYGGKPFGTKNSVGYIQGSVMGVGKLAHRLAWQIYYGEIPSMLDHVNGVKSDNRISNLRAASFSENNRNVPPVYYSKSGVVGVGWMEKKQMWRARIGINGKSITLCKSKKIEVAIAARKRAEEKYHGEFSAQKCRAIASEPCHQGQ